MSTIQKAADDFESTIAAGYTVDVLARSEKFEITDQAIEAASCFFGVMGVFVSYKKAFTNHINKLKNNPATSNEPPPKFTIVGPHNAAYAQLAEKYFESDATADDLYALAAKHLEDYPFVTTDTKDETRINTVSFMPRYERTNPNDPVYDQQKHIMAVGVITRPAHKVNLSGYAEHYDAKLEQYLGTIKGIFISEIGEINTDTPSGAYNLTIPEGQTETSLFYLNRALQAKLSGDNQALETAIDKAATSFILNNLLPLENGLLDSDQAYVVQSLDLQNLRQGHNAVATRNIEDINIHDELEKLTNIIKWDREDPKAALKLFNNGPMSREGIYFMGKAIEIAKTIEDPENIKHDPKIRAYMKAAVASEIINNPGQTGSDVKLNFTGQNLKLDNMPPKGFDVARFDRGFINFAPER